MTEFKTRLRGLKTIHGYNALGMLFIVLLAYFQQKLSGDHVVAGENGVLGIVIPIAMFMTGLSGYLFNASKIKKIKAMHSAEDKVNEYKKAQVSLYYFFILAFILPIVSYLLSSDNNYLIYSLMVAVLLIYIRPNKLRVKKDLGLSDEEAEGI